MSNISSEVYVDDVISNEGDWPAYRDIIYLTYPHQNWAAWTKKIYPTVELRQKFLQHFVKDHKKKIDNEKAGFVTLKMKNENGGSKFEVDLMESAGFEYSAWSRAKHEAGTVVGGLTLEYGIIKPSALNKDYMSQLYKEQNIWLHDKFYQPLLSIIEEHGGELWTATVFAIHPMLQRKGVGKDTAEKVLRKLGEPVMEEVKSGKRKIPPIVSFVTYMDLTRDMFLKTNSEYIGNVAYTSEDGTVNPNYMFICPVKGVTEDIIKSAKAIVESLH